MTLSFAPDAIEQWPLDRLKPYARNAKMHGADQVAKIAASMAEFGWTVPCLVADDGELIAGHGRVLAAEQLGLKEAPVIVLGHLSDEQRRAYRIADNKLTELGEWNEVVLSEELQLLASEDFDLSLIGFDDSELDALLSGLEGETDTDGEDDIPEPPEDPVSRPGDLWVLGNHRLLCGDATDGHRCRAGAWHGANRKCLMVCRSTLRGRIRSRLARGQNRSFGHETSDQATVLNDDRADWSVPL